MSLEQVKDLAATVVAGGLMLILGVSVILGGIGLLLDTVGNVLKFFM